MWQTTLYETSRLTLELRDIVDNGDNSVDIWDFEYPSFYKGDDKKAFEKKVIDHYYFRQIGQETVGRFLHMFRTRVREIMPYYIQLYESEKYMKEIEDPFATVDYTETYEEETTGQMTGQSSGTASGNGTSSVSGTQTGTHNTVTDSEADKEHRFSNTPQGSISNLDNYMTEASKDKETNSESVEGSTSGQSSSETTEKSSSESTAQSSSESSGTTKRTLTKKGAMGVTTFGHDMIEYRQSFLNIDLMIIHDLNDLFLGVY